MIFYNQIDIVEMWSEYRNASMMIATNAVGYPRLSQSYAEFCTQTELTQVQHRTAIPSAGVA